MITEQDVRMYLLDRTVDDHTTRPDVVFTPEQISFAMVTAARRYNSVRPYVDYVQPDNLPGDTNLFLDGIAGALFDMLRANTSLNDIDYVAGNVTANVNGNLLKNAEASAAFHNDRFMREASELKISRNLQHAFGRIG
jgi:hypothetical protein